MIALKVLLQKYNFLIKLVTSISVLLFLPMSVLGGIMMQRFYIQLQQKNDEFYYESVRGFAGRFTEQINNLREVAFRISLNAKVMRANPTVTQVWADIELIKNLQEINTTLPITEEMGVYYKKDETVYTSKNKHSYAQYAAQMAAGDVDAEAAMRAVFMENDSKKGRVASIRNPDGTRRILVAIPVILNTYNRYDAVVFFVLTEESMREFLTSTFPSGQYGFVILSPEDGFLFVSHPAFEALLGEEEYADLTLPDGQWIYRRPSGWPLDEKNETPAGMNVYKHTDGEDIYLIFTSDMAVYRNIDDFYHGMRRIYLLAVSGVILLLALTAGLNYLPLLKLVRSVGGGAGDAATELETLGQAITRMEDAVSEKDFLLMEYVAGDLLCGVGRRESEVSRLAPGLACDGFCAVTVDCPSPDNALRSRLAEAVRGPGIVHSFVTDIPNRRHSVFICALGREAAPQTVREAVEEAVRQLLHHEYALGVGDIVPGLDEIRQSYITSLAHLEAGPGGFEVMENYPTEALALFVQHIKYGDGRGAEARLNELFQFARFHATVAAEGYLCYELLTAYLNCARQMGCPPDAGETQALLSFYNAGQLHGLLKRAVGKTCEAVARLQQDANIKLKREIRQHVDAHYMDSDMTLLQVADRFGMSIYTLSRLFKDIAGIGFKEYVSAKRLELSRSLLLASELSIAQIAARVGFENATYFTRLFKSTYGITPSVFRLVKAG